jgi:hypothetical protein
MVQPVTDVRSNSKDQIAHAAEVLGRSKHRMKIFEALHTSRSRVKSISQLEDETGLTHQRVLDEARRLCNKQLIEQTTKGGELAYKRDNFYYEHRKQILTLARNPKKLKEFPTKYSTKTTTVRLAPVPKKLISTKIVTIDDVDSFAKASKVKHAATRLTISENTFKKGVQKLIKERGRFKDWGGETSDLYTSRVKLNGKRRTTAFGFKGKGLKGVLTPARMGKNGDQIHRLFLEDADLYFVQYGEQIAGSVMRQMAVEAQMRSYTSGRTIHYGVIDGQDSAALVAAYPKAFKGKR